MDDEIFKNLRALTEQHKELQRLLSPPPEVQRLMDDVRKQDAAFKAAYGGTIANLQRQMEEAHRVFAPVKETSRLLSEQLNNMRLPEMEETRRLIEQLHDPLRDTLERYRFPISELQKSLDAMRTPWLDTARILPSLSGIAELQGMGAAIATMPAFDDVLASALRFDLGDWRDIVTIPSNALTDIAARSALYERQGFNRAITDVPEPTFEETLEISGLRAEPPQLVLLYGSPVPAFEDSDEEENATRANDAHDWLFRAEGQIRRFIDELMIDAFGRDWYRHRLPNGMLDRWVEKQQRRESNGGDPLPIIAYADFTDYEPIICKRDNWPVFVGYFLRLEGARESFQRLYAMRIDVMHARGISQEDQLLLFAEVRRLMRAITKF